LNLAVKAALVGLLLFSVFSGLERFEGKAMSGRALTYPLAAVIVPIGWWIYRRRGAFVTGWLISRRDRAPASPQPERRPA
jgi:hypothetical protein